MRKFKCEVDVYVGKWGGLYDNTLVVEDPMRSAKVNHESKLPSWVTGEAREYAIREIQRNRPQKQPEPKTPESNAFTELKTLRAKLFRFRNGLAEASTLYIHDGQVRGVIDEIISAFDEELFNSKEFEPEEKEAAKLWTDAQKQQPKTDQIENPAGSLVSLRWHNNVPEWKTSDTWRPFDLSIDYPAEHSDRPDWVEHFDKKKKWFLDNMPASANIVTRGDGLLVELRWNDGKRQVRRVGRLGDWEPFCTLSSDPRSIYFKTCEKWFAANEPTSDLPMSLNEYQKLAMRTIGDSKLEILGLGITGEAGEVADEIKKHCGHGHELNEQKVLKELGDTLWYISALATRLGFTLEGVAKSNIEKLQKRYPEGFSAERSIHREEEV